MTRFTLYGSPHSLPTYKVALMLRLSGAPFSFRYVSFQKGMHKTPEFSACLAGARSPCWSTRTRAPAIGGNRRASGRDPREVRGPAMRRLANAAREWLFWDLDAPIPTRVRLLCRQAGAAKASCRSTSIRRLPITIAAAPKRRWRTLNSHLSRRAAICVLPSPHSPDLFCYGDVAFAEALRARHGSLGECRALGREGEVFAGIQGTL